ncbi:GntR family transcriptional regulator [Pseudonocardia nematodicida]|uniref:GntR family transcriptional regulator n=1 Tax=Pseudonocardia nematodicida TaxID=1206997 RepID=UPI0036D272B0
MTSTGPFKLGTASLTDALIESVRARIINGDIAPGEKITEIRLTTEYRVARSTAKACIEHLTGLGLIRRVAHKTAIVPRLTESEIEDLFFSRSTFEATAAGHLARLRRIPDEVSRAQQAIGLAVDRGDFAESVQADIAFHWGLVHGFESERLSRMYEMISGEIHLTMGQYSAHRRTSPSTVMAEHQAVLDAITAGDEKAACAALTEHIRLAKERIVAELRESG